MTTVPVNLDAEPEYTVTRLLLAGACAEQYWLATAAMVAGIAPTWLTGAPNTPARCCTPLAAWIP